MLRSPLLHPTILAALARAGHGSKVLIADGNYPAWTRRGPNAEVVHLALAPGMPPVTDVLRVLGEVTPIEAAEVMTPPAGSPEPTVFAELRALLSVPLTALEREPFYRAAGSSDVALTIVTGEERLYANVLLTIGVVPPRDRAPGR